MSFLIHNLSKNGYVWATQWPTSSELKIKFDPSFDRPWCEFFKIIKDHGPKNPPLGCNLAGLFSSPSGHLKKEKSAECSVHLYSSPWTVYGNILYYILVTRAYDLWSSYLCVQIKILHRSSYSIRFLFVIFASQSYDFDKRWR